METTIFKEKLALPSLPLYEWKETKNTLHLFLQIIGKIRLSFYLKVYNWWHTSLYISSRGLKTGTVPYKYGIFEIELDLINHRLIIHTVNNTKSFSLYDGLTVSEFYNKVILNLLDLGIEVNIDTAPYHCFSEVYFEKDTTHRSYNKEYIERFFEILGFVDVVFEEFRSKFNTKTTQVHLFWDSFDLALRRFSGNPTHINNGINREKGEAYSHQVISFGFWAGDDDIQEPAFYSYTYPEPKNIMEESLKPDNAFWRSLHGRAIALMMYEEIRNSDSPKEIILNFLESTYQVEARKAGWIIGKNRPKSI